MPETDETFASHVHGETALKPMQTSMAYCVQPTISLNKKFNFNFEIKLIILQRQLFPNRRVNDS